MTRQLLILDDAPITGGAELFALRLALWLAAARPEWTATIVCPRGSGLADVCAEAGIANRPAEFPDLSPLAAPQMLPAIRTIAALLREAAAGDTLVVANTARSQAYAAVARLAMRHPPVVVNLVHEQETARRRTARAVFERTGRVVAVGANNAATYRAALPGVEVVQLNNFLAPASLSAAPSPQRAHRAGPPIAGVLGRLIPEKGITELISELASVPESWHSLLIVGEAQDSSYTEEIDALVAAKSLRHRVERRGPTSDLASFFGSIDVLIVPSTGTEGQPTVILEALAHGLPVVVRRPVWSTDFQGLPVTPYSNPADLAAALASPHTGVPDAELRRRFGPEQALAALVAAGRTRA